MTINYPNLHHPLRFLKSFLLLLLMGFSMSCTHVSVRPPQLLIISERTPSQVSIVDTSKATPDVLRLVPGDPVLLDNRRVALIRWDLADLKGMVADGSGRLHVFCPSQGESLKIKALPSSAPWDDALFAGWWQAGPDLPTLAEGRTDEIDGRRYMVFDISTAEMQRWIDGHIAGLALEGEGKWDLGRAGGNASLSFAVHPGKVRP